MPSRGRRTNVALTAFLWAGNRKQVNRGKKNRVGGGKEEHGKSDSLPAWPVPVHLGKVSLESLWVLLFPPTLSSRGWMGTLFISLPFTLFSLLQRWAEVLGFSAGLVSDFLHLREMWSLPSSADTCSVATIWFCLQCKHFLQHLPTQLTCSGLSQESQITKQVVHKEASVI